MSYYGDIALGATLDVKFTTRQFSTGAPFALAGTPAVAAYVDNGTTEITAGITLTNNFDSRTGLHNVRVVASAGNGFAAGTNVQLVLTAGTVDSVSVVGEVVGSFSIEARSALRPTTAGRTLDVSAGGEAGVDWANVGSPSTTVGLSGTTVGTATALGANAVNSTSVANDAITAAKIASNAITAGKIATDAIGAAQLASDAVTEIQSGLATSSALSTVAGYLDTEIAAILEDTGTTLPAQIAALNNLSEAQVNAQVDAALADYDGPTNAEMVARTLAAADYATATALGTVDGIVDDILADTADMQPKLGTPSNLGSGATLAANLADIEAQTDDIGAAGAGLTALASASALTALDGKVDDVKTVTDDLAQLLEDDGGTPRFTANALALAPSGGGAMTPSDFWAYNLNGSPSPAPGSAGAYLLSASAAGDPWGTPLPGAYTPGQAGYILGTNLDAAISSRLAAGSYTAPPSAATVASQVRTELTTELGRIDVATSTRLASASYTAPANSDIADIKAKTDNLPASPAATGDIPSASTVAGAVWDAIVEGSYSARQYLRGLAASNFGKGSGWDTTDGVYRDPGDTKNRIAATVDEHGNRTAVTLDLD